MGIMTELGGVNPLLNFDLNFRESNKNTDYREGAFRLDSRYDLPLFQWLSRLEGEHASPHFFQ